MSLMISKNSGNTRKNKARWPLFLLLLTAIGSAVYLCGVDHSLVLYQGQQPEDKPLRLHVLAHSDDPQDQQLKLAVRDHIIVELQETLSGAADREQAIAAVRQRLPQLQASCAEFLRTEAAYGATVSLSEEYFPAIEYGDIIMAEGRYDALKIVLGEGAGHNWWCVLFPPLCFVDLAGEYQQQPAVSVLARDGQAQAAIRVEWKLQELFR